MSTATPTSFVKRLLGPTQTIEPTGPALTLRYALPSDTDTSTASPSSTRTARHVAWSWSPRSAASCRLRSRSTTTTWSPTVPAHGRNHLLPRVWLGTGYDRPAIG